VKIEMKKRDREIAKHGPSLKRRGCVRGIDVIGDYLTEINVPPAGLQRSNR